MSLVDRLPVSQATVALPVLEELTRITGVFVRTSNTKSDHSTRAAAVARATAVRMAGRREVARPFRRLTLKQAANLPTSIVGGGFSHA